MNGKQLHGAPAPRHIVGGITLDQVEGKMVSKLTFAALLATAVLSSANGMILEDDDSHAAARRSLIKSRRGLQSNNDFIAEVYDGEDTGTACDIVTENITTWKLHNMYDGQTYDDDGSQDDKVTTATIKTCFYGKTASSMHGMVSLNGPSSGGPDPQAAANELRKSPWAPIDKGQSKQAARIVSSDGSIMPRPGEVPTSVLRAGHSAPSAVSSVSGAISGSSSVKAPPKNAAGLKSSTSGSEAATPFSSMKRHGSNSGSGGGGSGIGGSGPRSSGGGRGRYGKNEPKWDSRERAGPKPPNSSRGGRGGYDSGGYGPGAPGSGVPASSISAAAAAAALAAKSAPLPPSMMKSSKAAEHKASLAAAAAAAKSASGQGGKEAPDVNSERLFGSPSIQSQSGSANNASGLSAQSTSFPSSSAATAGAPAAPASSSNKPGALTAAKDAAAAERVQLGLMRQQQAEREQRALMQARKQQQLQEQQQRAAAAKAAQAAQASSTSTSTSPTPAPSSASTASAIAAGNASANALANSVPNTGSNVGVGVAGAGNGGIGSSGAESQRGAIFGRSKTASGPGSGQGQQADARSGGGAQAANMVSREAHNALRDQLHRARADLEKERRNSEASKRELTSLRKTHAALQERFDRTMQNLRRELDTVRGDRDSMKPDSLTDDLISQTLESFSVETVWKEAYDLDEASVKALPYDDPVRPQHKLLGPVDNTTSPFTPRIRFKPHAVSQLNREKLLSEPWKSPYADEIERLRYANELPVPRTNRVRPVHSLLQYPFKFVDQEYQLEELARLLESGGTKEVGVAMQNHSFRSYQGFLCLLQISTDDTDFVIDTLVLRQHISILASFFANPDIVKVMHNAEGPVRWLQRDFDIYVVNMVDLALAAEEMNLQERSFAFMLKNCIGAELDTSEIGSDWRARPLSFELLKYAQQFSHYMLDVYRQVYFHAGEDTMRKIFARSCGVALLTYQKRPVSQESISAKLTELQRSHKEQAPVSAVQRAVFAALAHWRDLVARIRDESVDYVMNDDVLYSLAKLGPISSHELECAVSAARNPRAPLLFQLRGSVLFAIARVLDQPLRMQPRPPAGDEMFKRPRASRDLGLGLGLRPSASALQLTALRSGSGGARRWMSDDGRGKPKSGFSGWEKKLASPSGGLPDFIEHWSRDLFKKTGAGLAVGAGVLGLAWGPSLGTFAAAGFVGAYWALGMRDMAQPSHTIRRNFPVLGHMRYLLESVRPEIRQYFIEDDNEGKPFSREQRSIVYQRAKGMSDTQPFGTRRDVYTEGYEWVNQSIWPCEVAEEKKRVTIGNHDCKQPYSASRLNISAMSYGALSDNAILALNEAAKAGNFYHNTGEGGVSRFHLQPGGDIVWNIGTGYFGCRNKNGTFDAAQFSDRVADPRIKMVEIKISQGAKPGHGGMLPGIKVTEKIAEARGVEVGETCNSPPGHSAFKDARGLIRFVDHLRELSDGKPVGFKLCMGKPTEIAAIIGAMREMDVYPDFITVDGAEGGTGAAPSEFSNHIGFPLQDALQFVNNMLVGADVRDNVKVIASGKVITGFSMVRAHALGADVCNSARAMMFALGCIQALKCNTNKCPTGITTSDPELMAGLHVPTKADRVERFHNKTLQNFFEIVGAMGLEDPRLLGPTHVMRRTAGGTYIQSYGGIFPMLQPGDLISRSAEKHPSNIQAFWDQGQELLRGKRIKSFPLTFKSTSHNQL
ncbi:Ferredoxin-dependent glutamate synthase [Hondaea fermentalgiana]|uniref:Ferredoxin-dependent glutamate synthase n=1 Tax=Hondaea fermentalgiana TaxID=2315210 RepID=A0A2R5G4F9_9STRA|nr:Ferredoxin-dependent glutamate synthase [Hondaea fermentalgiana]|eukprot:GBG25880.1 Ferredoxin-dependent glutamate synthase [Hondaea fermentalgiana]